MLANRLLTNQNSGRYVAIGEGVLVTLILGSTLVFVKMALNYLAPLTIAAGRYCLAFTILLPFMVGRTTVSRFPNSLWIRFFLIGLSFYVIGNGALFWGLKYIPRVLCC